MRFIEILYFFFLFSFWFSSEAKQRFKDMNVKCNRMATIYVRIMSPNIATRFSSYLFLFKYFLSFSSLIVSSSTSNKNIKKRTFSKTKKKSILYTSFPKKKNGNHYKSSFTQLPVHNPNHYRLNKCMIML